MKFLLDEHVHPAVESALLASGIDVTTVQKEGKSGLPDTEILEFAKSAGRVIVTSDADFLRLDAQGRGHEGIVFITDSMKPVGRMVRALEKLDLLLSVEDMRNHVEFV